MTFKYYALKLTAICVIVFILQNAFPITEEFLLSSSEILIKPWILVTSIFLHGDVAHLLYNMFALALFGSILEKIVGGRKFLYIFFITGVIASIGSAIFYPASLGASGAVFGLMGALAALRPRMVIWFYGAPMPMFVAAIFWIAINFSGMFFPGNIAYASHLFGIFTGIAIGIVLRSKYEEVKQVRRHAPASEREIEDWEDRFM